MKASRKLPIVVVGCGPAGSICARQLALRGHRVVAFERSAGDGTPVGETCGPRLLHFLRERCGLSLPAEVGSPLERFHSAWGSETLEARDHRLWSGGHGAILNRGVFDKWLREEARCAGAEIVLSTTVTSGKWDDDRWSLTFQTATSIGAIDACFVVEASGRAGSPALFSDAGRIYIDRLMGVVAQVAGEGPLSVSALIESADEGWWYGAQLPTGCRVIAYFTDADFLPASPEILARFSRTKHLQRFAPELNDRTSFRPTPARTSIRRLLWRGSWVAIGDAALCIDPLSGRGIERAVIAGFEAAESIHCFLMTSGGSELQRYAISQTELFQEELARSWRSYFMEQRWPAAPFWNRRHLTIPLSKVRQAA